MSFIVAVTASETVGLSLTNVQWISFSGVLVLFASALPGCFPLCLHGFLAKLARQVVSSKQKAAAGGGSGAGGGRRSSRKRSRSGSRSSRAMVCQPPKDVSESGTEPRILTTVPAGEENR